MGWERKKWDFPLLSFPPRVACTGSMRLLMTIVRKENTRERESTGVDATEEERGADSSAPESAPAKKAKGVAKGGGRPSNAAALATMPLRIGGPMRVFTMACAASSLERCNQPGDYGGGREPASLRIGGPMRGVYHGIRRVQPGEV